MNLKEFIEETNILSSNIEKGLLTADELDEVSIRLDTIREQLRNKDV